MAHVCNFCAQPHSQKMCSKCQRVYYCSEEHHRNDWRLRHKYECDAFQYFCNESDLSDVDRTVEKIIHTLSETPAWYTKALTVKLQRMLYFETMRHLSPERRQLPLNETLNPWMHQLSAKVENAIENDERMKRWYRGLSPEQSVLRLHKKMRHHNMIPFRTVEEFTTFVGEERDVYR